MTDIWKRYQDWRATLGTAAFFALACVEVLAMIGAYIAFAAAVVFVISAPSLFGDAGFMMWFAIGVAGIAGVITANREIGHD